MAEWKNRIVGTGEVDPNELNAHPKNWRTHPQGQERALASALDEVGWVTDVIVNRRTGLLVDGHLRVELAVQRAEGRVPVKYVDLSEREEALVLATFDPITSLAGADEDMLAELVADIELPPELAATLDGFDLERIEDGETDPDDVPEDEPEPRTSSGDVWQLGRHRLLCGECTEIGSILDGREYDLLVTDPPYGVSYASKNKFLNWGGGHRIETEIEHDNHTIDEMFALWSKWFSCIREFAKPGASYYITGPQGGDPLHSLMKALRDAGFTLRHMLIWSKNNHVIGRCDYHYKHEPILYGWVEGTHHKVKNRSEVSVWEIDKPLKSELHPTMKPVELYERAYRNSSRRGELVLEPFAGSGTAYIAAERLGRVCYGSEISPQYCDVIVERWERFAGREAEKCN